MRKLKIGITCYPTVGGSGVIATELGKMLAERGHEIHFITSSVPFRLNKIYPTVFFHEVEVNNYSVFLNFYAKVIIISVYESFLDEFLCKNILFNEFCD